ncbi:helix-turn-helix domain-containing protein [Microcystis aeruginosa]|uniref:Tc1-like transposase DDE domain-containing protein n=1 Tax=Microcystis aeruginosa NIES-2521 TaxID=2303983 RepID=A0A5A5S3W7_MICAE|nr:hypothetical protein MiTs_04040 [Microcystis aeruginosa NIES-2521]
MVGVTSTVVKESAEELTQRLKEATTAREKDKLQVLYWLKQEKAPTLKVIAESLGHHRNTVQSWLCKYREQGLQGMLERKKSKGRVRVIPEWAEKALEKRLKAEEKGFKSYGEVQEWHTSKKLVIPENIILLFQPPYCPELNPIERVREELKKEIKWSCFKTLEELEVKVDELFKKLTPQRVASLTGFPFILDALSALNTI